MEKQQKKRMKQYFSWALVLVIVAFLACLPLIASNEQPTTGPQASILSAQVEHRSLSETVSGGGKLLTDDAMAITIPLQVKIKEYLVENGDTVTKGQPVATVDRVTVMAAIAEVQETLEEIRTDLNKIASEKESTKVNAQASGTVKIIYGTVGENVQDVILRDGALAVISLDGLMAVQISRNTKLTSGDTVCVELSNGTTVSGKVKSNLEGVLTITLEDEGYPVGDKVKVTTEDGDRIGTGSLYIHNPWNVLAYSGTISRIRVTEGSAVSAGKRLFDLENTGHTAQFDALSHQHREYEALMLELFKMYQSEAATAPQDGMITGVDATGTYMLSSTGGSIRASLLANAPNGDNESEYTNYVGQVTEVGSDGLILRINPQAVSITDYMDLSGVPRDTSLMTYQTPYWASAPIYELSGTEWVQISTASIQAGDILLFTGSGGTFVWVIRIGSAAPPEPTEPPTTAPTDPTKPVDPGNSDKPSTPSAGSSPQGTPNVKVPQGGGAPSMGGSAAPEEEDKTELLDTVTIASVIAQGDVTVQISIDELDISKIYVGQQATVTLDALRGEEFVGTVTNISNSGANEGGNSKFTVDVTIPKAANMIPGMTAHVAIAHTCSEAVTSIPVAALTDFESGTVVYTGYDEETDALINPVSVTTGVSDGEYVQILSGLSAGDTVYYPYYDTLVISNRPDSGGIPFG